MVTRSRPTSTTTPARASARKAAGTGRETAAAKQTAARPTRTGGRGATVAKAAPTKKAVNKAVPAKRAAGRSRATAAPAKRNAATPAAAKSAPTASKPAKRSAAKRPAAKAAPARRSPQRGTPSSSAATKRTAAKATPTKRAAKRTAASARAARQEDGRRLRAARNRAAVVDAVLTIIRAQAPSGGPLPGAAEVAKRAGVSERTVFRHFADLDALFLAAAAFQRPVHEAYVAPRPSAPALEDRVAEIVRLRAKLYEEIAPVRRVAVRLAVAQPVLADQINQAYDAARDQIIDTFAPELARADARRRAALEDALDVAAGWSTWDKLRAQRGLTVERTKRVQSELLTSLLEPLAKARAKRR